MKNQLNEKEHEILQILMNSGVPMTASEIVKTDSKWTVNIVQAILRKLLSMKFIVVADIVYSRNVLSRAYKPAENVHELVESLFADDVAQFKKLISSTSLLSALLGSINNRTYSEKDMETLEQIIKNTKK